jgi:serine/threonine protein kinase
MSVLYLADDQKTRQQVVVKVPLPIFSSGVGSWSLFQREEEIGLQLDHPYVLRFIPLPAHQRRSYVVTEFVAGQTLADTLAAEGPMPEARALVIASQTCAALAHIHARGFVHYDLKPANIILCPDGDLRLIDFGLAHAALSGRFSFSGAAPAIASAGYLAPEQIRRKRGRKSVDIYGVGAVLYEMLTGKIPFPDDDPFTVGSARLVGDPASPRTLRPQLSPQVEEIVLRALRRNPEDRYASAEALKADLDAPQSVVVTGIAQHLQPPTSWRKFARKARYVFLVCGVPLLAQVVLFALLWRRFSAR